MSRWFGENGIRGPEMNKPKETSAGRRSGATASELTIFINYRRGDTAGQAQALTDRLRLRFGKENVYFDVDQQGGIDWLAEIEAKGAAAGAFLALIGPDWLRSLKERSATGQAPDYVRAEIEWALNEWPGVVIPVLVDAQMPPEPRLPRSVRDLCRKQAARLRRASFDQDVQDLIDCLGRVMAA